MLQYFCLHEAGAAAGCAAADDCQLTVLPTNKHQVTESKKEQAVVSRENWYHKCLSEILFDNSKDQLQAHRNTG